MRLLLLPILLVTCIHITYAQSDTIAATCCIKGIVNDEEGNPIPGATVKGYHRSDRTVTDAQGKFTLPCHTILQTIIVSFIGYKSQELLADTTHFVQITLESDLQPLEGKALYCVFYNRYIRAGLSSGFRYTPVGFRIDSYVPYLFDEWPHLSTTFEWRTSNTGNHYYNISVRRHELARIQNKQLSLFAEFKKIEVASADIWEFSFAPELPFGRTRVSPGYMYQQATQAETAEKGHGVYLAFYMYLPEHLEIDLKARYVLDNFQYDGKMYWNFWRSRIRSGIGLERIGLLNEFTASLQYQLNY